MFHQDPQQRVREIIHSRLQAFHVHPRAHQHHRCGQVLLDLVARVPPALVLPVLVASAQVLPLDHSDLVAQLAPVRLAAQLFHLHAQALAPAALLALLVLALPVLPQQGAVALRVAAVRVVAVVPPEPSASRAESRIKHVRVRNCAVKNSTICRRPNWVASSSRAAMAQRSFGCPAVPHSLTLPRRSMPIQRP